MHEPAPQSMPCPVIVGMSGRFRSAQDGWASIMTLMHECDCPSRPCSSPTPRVIPAIGQIGLISGGGRKHGAQAHRDHESCGPCSCHRQWLPTISTSLVTFAPHSNQEALAPASKAASAGKLRTADRIWALCGQCRVFHHDNPPPWSWSHVSSAYRFAPRRYLSPGLQSAV